MEATNKLRFVERKDYTEDAANPRTLRILQQWWEKKQWAHEDYIVIGGEWRDVPVEEEIK
jgi:hypothetical protein